MATSSRGALRTIERLLQKGSLDDLVSSIQPVSPEDTPLGSEVPHPIRWGEQATADRRAFVEAHQGRRMPYLFGEEHVPDDGALRGNIENFIGMTLIPTGLIGPLRINGPEAKGDFYVPMATSEGALVASYNRGARVVSLAGGVTSVCTTEAVQRSPVFRFRTFAEVGVFLIWVLSNRDSFPEIVAGCSSHARLEEIRPNIDGNQLTLLLEYTTGDAAGQNMVTLCTEAICRYLVANAPVKPQRWFVEGNLSGDKKATAISFTTVRGKKVTAEAFVPKNIVEQQLNTTPDAMLEYWKVSVANGVQSGSFGVNGHFANCLAAMFLACGQDAACVAEASVGITRFDVFDGGLYASVTMPNLIVGSVGGGTDLPTQRECLDLLGCRGEGGSRKFAEICAATVLCGELSIVGAITAGDFSKAHALFGRKKRSSAR